MKPSAFLGELEKIQLWLEDEQKKISKKYYEYTGFYAGLDSEITAGTFKKGFWSSFIFAYDRKASFGLCVFPDQPMSTWPVVRNFENYSAVTFSSNIRTFICFQQIFALLNKNLFKSVSRNWETVMNLNAPLCKLFGTTAEDMEFIKNYAFDGENEPISSEEKDNIVSYLEFWNHYDTSKAHQIMRELINKLNESKKWLPDVLPFENLGIWETRIKNLLMSRAKSNRIGFGNERVKEFIIQGFMQPHGYDVENIVFSHFPKLNTSKTSISAVVDYFSLAEDILPESFTESHFYKAALEIDKNFNGYQGEEHYHAALVLESEGKPLEAWHALVSASYWAGINGDPDGVEKHWQKAIAICKNQNWADSHDALTTQWEWYQDYKSKNL